MFQLLSSVDLQNSPRRGSNLELSLSPHSPKSLQMRKQEQRESRDHQVVGTRSKVKKYDFGR